MPERIQLRRVKGWKKPAAAVNVARPSKWGNPFTFEWAANQAPELVGDLEGMRRFLTLVYRSWVYSAAYSPWWDEKHRDAYARVASIEVMELTGRDLACWCPLDGPCHADVLLEVANRRDK